MAEIVRVLGVVEVAAECGNHQRHAVPVDYQRRGLLVAGGSERGEGRRERSD